MKHFLIIDDHVIVRFGIKSIFLNEHMPCEVFEAGNEARALELLSTITFDLVIMDVQIPNADMVKLMEYITNNYPGTKVLIFSMNPENIYATRFLKAGARGFVNKATGNNELEKAIKQVLNNRFYISENLANILIEKPSENPFQNLSPREFEVASELVKGKSITEIAQTLNLQIATIATFKARLFAKLNIKGIPELIKIWNLYNPG